MSYINLKVIPRASKNELTKLTDTGWKVRLTSAPVEGQANQDLIKFLAKELGVKKSQIEIIKGFKSRNKVIRIIE